MNHLLIAFFAILVFSPSANAQNREYRSGLNYTTINQSKAKPATQAEPAKTTQEETDTSKEDPAAQIWNKYKELASGTAIQENTDQENTDIAKPEKPTISKPTLSENPQPASQQKSGFAAILEQWQNSKRSKREMKSRSFEVPKAAKPAIETEK